MNFAVHMFSTTSDCASTAKATNIRPTRTSISQQPPAPINDVLELIAYRFQNLEIGVSSTAEILEMLNQVLTAITMTPRTKYHPSKVFEDHRLTSFISNSVMKSVRRFHPNDIMKTCWIVTRAERLGITELRTLLIHSLEALINGGRKRPVERNDTDKTPNCSGENLGNLSVAQYCQLPLILSSFHQVNALELELINRVFDWMDHVVGSYR